jgi:hypothetical protein
MADEIRDIVDLMNEFEDKFQINLGDVTMGALLAQPTLPAEVKSIFQRLGGPKEFYRGGNNGVFSSEAKTTDGVLDEHIYYVNDERNGILVTDIDDGLVRLREYGDLPAQVRDRVVSANEAYGILGRTFE